MTTVHLQRIIQIHQHGGNDFKQQGTATIQCWEF